jgi:hypothetical protein
MHNHDSVVPYPSPIEMKYLKLIDNRLAILLTMLVMVLVVGACTTTYEKPDGTTTQALVVGQRTNGDSLELMSSDLLGFAFGSYLVGFVTGDSTDENGQDQVEQSMFPVDSLIFTEGYPIKQGEGDYYVVCRAKQRNAPNAWLFAARCTWEGDKLLLVHGQELHAISWKLNCPAPNLEWDATNVKGFSPLPAGCELFRQRMGK